MIAVEASGAKTLGRVVSYLLAHDERFTLSNLNVLLEVVQKQGDHGALVSDIRKATGLNQSTVSRNLSFLGDEPYRGQRSGLRWVTAHVDHEDPRRMRYTLTKKGEHVVEEIERIIN